MVIRENNLSETLSLDGEWQIIAGDYSGVVRVPGVWDLQGVDAQTVIYRRAVFVPESWSGAAIMLQFDAVSYHIEAFVNSVPVGMHDGLWAAFDFDISGAVQFGAENTIELHVTKPNPHDKPPYSYREVLVGFIPYVSTTFGGIWQSARLVAHRAGMFTNIQVQPDIGKRCVSLGIERKTSHADSEIEVTVLDPTDHYIVTLQRYDNSQEIPIPDVKVWSPDAPNLYTVIVREKIGDTVIGEVRRQFGFRRLHNDGSRLLFNGAPITLRGVLSWGWDPATLAPTPTDEQIRDEFRRVRELGFNLYKLCLYVPPKRVFEIADEEGMLLWLEMPMWWQRTTEQFHQQTRDEYRDVFRQVHHHPSIVIYSLGCELDSDMANVHLLASLNYLAREHTRDALICDNSGSGEAYGGLAFDFADFNDYHFYADMHFFTPLLDHFRRDWRTQRPLIFGEFCDCDARLPRRRGQPDAVGIQRTRKAHGKPRPALHRCAVGENLARAVVRRAKDDLGAGAHTGRDRRVCDHRTARHADQYVRHVR
jgi:beta-galactosidase/beta-glucuronidase